MVWVEGWGVLVQHVQGVVLVAFAAFIPCAASLAVTRVTQMLRSYQFKFADSYYFAPLQLGEIEPTVTTKFSCASGVWRAGLRLLDLKEKSRGTVVI